LSTAALYARHIAPWASGGATVVIDSASALKAGSPTHRLARYCRIYRGVRLWGEPAEVLSQSFWLSELGGVVCMTYGLDQYPGRDQDRLAFCYDNSDDWMIRRDFTGKGLGAIALVQQDEPVRRAAIVAQVAARGWEPCTFMDAAPVTTGAPA
jgi:hypothetical protein